MTATPADAAVSVNGQVLGAGAPITNSMVTLYAASAGAPKQMAQAKTGADGRFTMTAPDNANSNASLYLIAQGGKPAPVLSGFTGDQRFYIAYGQSWREIWTDGRTRQIVLSNPHSPAKFRVNGVVRNDDGWYAAFDVKPGDAMYLPPESRVRLW